MGSLPNSNLTSSITKRRKSWKCACHLMSEKSILLTLACLFTSQLKGGSEYWGFPYGLLAGEGSFEMTANQFRVRGALCGVMSLCFFYASLTMWKGNALAVVGMLSATAAFFVSVMFFIPKKLVKSIRESLPGNRLPYAEEEHTYSKEAEMVRAAQLRHGIRTVDRFNLLEIAGEVVREAVAAERKLWMKKNKKGGGRGDPYDRAGLRFGERRLQRIQAIAPWGRKTSLHG